MNSTKSDFGRESECSLGWIEQLLCARLELSPLHMWSHSLLAIILWLWVCSHLTDVELKARNIKTAILSLSHSEAQFRWCYVASKGNTSFLFQKTELQAGSVSGGNAGDLSSQEESAGGDSTWVVVGATRLEWHRQYLNENRKMARNDSHNCNSHHISHVPLTKWARRKGNRKWGKASVLIRKSSPMFPFFQWTSTFLLALFIVFRHIPDSVACWYSSLCSWNTVWPLTMWAPGKWNKIILFQNFGQ